MTCICIHASNGRTRVHESPEQTTHRLQVHAAPVDVGVPIAGVGESNTARILVCASTVCLSVCRVTVCIV